MGTTFANMHIHKLPITDLERLLPDYCVLLKSESWISVLNLDFDLKEVGKLARKLSKQIEQTIFTVEYFDDEVLFFTVYRRGKKVISHIWNDYRYVKRTGDVSLIRNELELFDCDIELMKQVLKCEKLGDKVILLEKLIGIPLWIDMQMYNESEKEKFTRNKDIEYVKEYFKDSTNTKKIVNKTKMKLSMELEGKYLKGFEYGYYLINTPNTQGKCIRGKQNYLIRLDKGGILTKVCDLSPYYYDAYYADIIADENNLVVSRRFSIGADNTEILLIDYKGNLLSNSICVAEQVYAMLMLEDHGVICSSNWENKKIKKYSKVGTVEWEFEVGNMYTGIEYYKNNLFFCYESKKANKYEIVKLNSSGNIEASFMFEGFTGWNKLQIDKNGRLYYYYTSNEDNCRTNKLLCLNEDFELLFEMEFPDKYTSWHGLLDENNDKLYIDITDQELIAVDLKKREVYAKRKNNDDIYMMCIDIKGNIVAKKGFSGVEVLDSNLNTISSHRLKGYIYDQYTINEGKVSFVTGKAIEYDQFGQETKELLRVYELLY